MKYPILAYPDPDRPFTIATDASVDGLGAILSQVHDGKERIVAAISRSLAPSERKWHQCELEAFGVVWAVSQFRPYIYGQHFTIVTDAASLRWIMKLKNPSSRLARGP